MIEWTDLSIEVLNTRKRSKGKYLELINGSNGQVVRGELLAIMGPSGGGKTTLLNALSGMIPAGARTQGVVTYDDRLRDDKWLDRIGFVNQDDVVYHSLTVRETLRYAALFRSILRNPKNSNGPQLSSMTKFASIFQNTSLDAKITNTIKDLKLTACADNLVKNLSGGERKRLMIGVELVSDPEILFLDEPTSGLDTLTALKIIRILKDLALKHQKIVILSIHQPSSEIFFMMDTVILLNKGNTVYYGPSSDVEEFFNAKGISKRPLVSVPEFILEVCSDEVDAEYSNLFYGEQPIISLKRTYKENHKRITRNEFRPNFEFNLFHIILLIMRQFYMDISSLTAFVKNTLSRMSVYAICALISSIAYNILQAVSFDQLLELFTPKNRFNLGMFNFKTTDPPIDAFLRGIICSFFTYMLLFSQINNATTSFINQLEIIRKEVSIDSYSATSFYIGNSLHFCIYEVFCITPAVIIYYFLSPNFLTKHVLALYYLSIFATVPIGLFIASFSSSKEVNKFLSAILSALMSFGPSIIVSLLKMFGNLGQRNIAWVTYLTYLCALLPTFHFNSMILYSIYTSYGEVEKLSRPLQHIASFLENQNVNDIFKYVGGLDLKFKHIFLLFVCVNTFYIIGGIFLHGILLMPDLRYKLEKLRVEKLQ